MAVDVICPKCHSRLRAPDNVQGKVVRCKKCQEKFRAGGGTLEGETPDDSQALSVMIPASEVPQVPQPAKSPVRANARDAESKPASADDLIILENDAPPRPATPVAPAGTAETFALDAPTRVPEKKGQPKAKTKLDETPRLPDRKKRNLLVPILLGVAFLFVMGFCVVGGAVYWFFFSFTDVASTPPTSLSKVAFSNPGDLPGDPVIKPPPSTFPDPPATTPTVPQGPVPPTTSTPATQPKVEPPPPAIPGGKIAEMPAAPVTFAKLKRTLSLETSVETIREVRMTSSAPPSAIVVYNSFPGFQGKGAEDTIERYGLATGAKAGKAVLSADGLSWPRPFAVSADASRFAVEAPPGKLTVFDFDANARLLNGIDNMGQPFRPAALFFITPDLLGVVDSNAALDVWDIKTKARKLRGPSSPRLANAAPPLARLIDAKQAVLFLDGQLRVISTETGVSLNSIPLAPPTAKGLALALDILGKRVAVVYATADAKPKHILAVVGLAPKSGQFTMPLPETATPRGLDWPSLETVVITLEGRDASLICGVDQRVVVGFAKGNLGKVPQFNANSTGEHWWAVSDASNPKKSKLVSVEFPFDGYAPLAANAKKNQTAAYLVPGREGLAK